MLIHKDKRNHFISMFNEKNGFYLRSGIIKDGRETDIDPFMSVS